MDAFNSDLVPEALKWRATISRTSPQCDEEKRVKEDTMPLLDLERSHKKLVDGPESLLWTRPSSWSEDTLRQQKGPPQRRTALRCLHVVPPKGDERNLLTSFGGRVTPNQKSRHSTDFERRGCLRKM